LRRTLRANTKGITIPGLDHDLIESWLKLTNEEFLDLMLRQLIDRSIVRKPSRVPSGGMEGGLERWRNAHSFTDRCYKYGITIHETSKNHQSD